MKQRTRAGFVLLLVLSLLIAENNGFAQGNQPVTLPAVQVAASQPATLPARLNMPSSTPTSTPQSGSGSRNWGLVAGLALSGTGAILAARKEPLHQTVCIAYDSCPVPGIVRVSGGLMMMVGVPLTIWKLKHR